jgi:RNA polymerase sigma-70 factor (ECF subfamily)
LRAQNGKQHFSLSLFSRFCSSIVPVLALYNVKEPAGPFMDNDEADLLQRWQGGDPTAFSILVRRWQQPIARFLFHLVGQKELAQDLCQEVFLRVFLAAPRYRETGQFSSWLYRIALNVVRDSSRRRGRELMSFEASDPLADSPGPEICCEQQELAQMVSQAVAELPEPLRVVLVLRHYEGISFEQMARMLGTPASTLKSRFAAALIRLRQRLQPLIRDTEESNK